MRKLVDKKATKLYLELSNLVLAEVEREARKILSQHSNLGEFVMGMGVYFFTDKHNNTVDTYEPTWDKPSYKYFVPLNEIFENWNDILKLTGEPMRFTATGKKQTNW